MNDNPSPSLSSHCNSLSIPVLSVWWNVGIFCIICNMDENIPITKLGCTFFIWTFFLSFWFGFCISNSHFPRNTFINKAEQQYSEVIAVNIWAGINQNLLAKPKFCRIGRICNKKKRDKISSNHIVSSIANSEIKIIPLCMRTLILHLD